MSALMQNAQDMLVRQQLEEATLRAASVASDSALREAQVKYALATMRHAGSFVICLYPAFYPALHVTSVYQHQQGLEADLLTCLNDHEPHRLDFDVITMMMTMIKLQRPCGETGTACLLTVTADRCVWPASRKISQTVWCTPLQARKP